MKNVAITAGSDLKGKMIPGESTQVSFHKLYAEWVSRLGALEYPDEPRAADKCNDESDSADKLYEIIKTADNVRAREEEKEKEGEEINEETLKELEASNPLVVCSEVAPPSI